VKRAFASSKETPCFRRLAWFFVSSHSTFTEKWYKPLAYLGQPQLTMTAQAQAKHAFGIRPHDLVGQGGGLGTSEGDHPRSNSAAASSPGEGS
jgi:hypothetical protein